MPRVTATRVADSNNVVHTIIGGKGDYCRTPCPECPWRKENAGNFPAEAFRISAITAYDMATNTFACHMRGKGKPATCAGFILRGGDDNLTVRIKRAQGQMLDVKADGAKLFPSYSAMAVANGVQKSDPAILPCMPEARRREDRERRRERS